MPTTRRSSHNGGDRPATARSWRETNEFILRGGREESLLAAEGAPPPAAAAAPPPQPPPVPALEPNADSSTGKKPPPSAGKADGKGVAKRRRSVRSGAGERSASKNSSSTARRRSSSASTTVALDTDANQSRNGNTGNNTKNNLPRYPLPCRDAYPQRITQPLVRPASVTGQASHTTTAAELVALSDVWHPLPDTYPLVYAAQLLGFSVPPTTQSSAPVSFQVQSLPMRRDVSYQHIPPLGKFATTVWQAPPPQPPLHTSPDLEDQQTLDILDPLYEQLLLTPDAVTAETIERVDGALVPAHLQRLTEWLVEACEQGAGGASRSSSSRKPSLSTTATTATTIKATPSPPSTTSKRNKTSPGEIFAQTLEQIQQVTGRQYTVHVYRPAIDANANIPFVVTPFVDCTNLPTLSTYRGIPLGLVLALNGYAVGSLLLEYQYISGVSVSSNTPPIQICWRRLVLSDVEIDSDANALVAIVLIALSMQHARYAARVRYGVYDYNVTTPPPYGEMVQKCFRLVRLALPAPSSLTETSTNDPLSKEEMATTVEVHSPQGDDCNLVHENGSSEENVIITPTTQSKPALVEAPVLVNSRIRLLADLSKSTTKYALLTWKRLMSDKAGGSKTPQEETKIEEIDVTVSHVKYRSLIRLPNVDEATSLIEGRLLRRKKLSAGTSSVSVFSSAPSAQRNISLQMQAILGEQDQSVQVTVGKEKTPVDIPDFIEDPMGFHVMKTFPICDTPEMDDTEDSDLLFDLKAKQAELTQLEIDLEPRLRKIMGKVVQERLDFEKGDYWSRQDEEQRILDANQKMLARRIVEDEEKMKRLEQDMDAVCCICDDGEVTPDNQIIFCESCDVPVHQLCYGVDKIPSEDYYCLACQHFGLDGKSRKTDSSQRSAGVLPVTCSLCPHPGGALVRSNVPLAPDDEEKLGTWVHVVCAKWQGLEYVNPKSPDLVEDFSELRDSFRRHKILCSLCEGDRGCMNRCAQEGCTTWMHILCARSSGLCTVIHGEDCHGDIPDNPWSLLCPKHSDIAPEDMPKNATPLPRLVEMAEKFPAEPEPELLPIAHMPFNEANADERRRLTADPTYEDALIHELLYKRHVGVRCEICANDALLSKDIIRCSQCAVSFCRGCLLDADDFEGSYKCPACRFLQSYSIEGGQEQPQCVACFQKGGPLRPAFATPVKKSTWHNNRKGFRRSIFAKKFWVHTLCAFWHEGLFFSSSSPGSVDFRDVVTINSKHGFIFDKYRCEVCGQFGGLKMICSHPGCVRKHGDKYESLYFHPTCARQAGLEVADSGEKAHVKCYRHGGNEYNLRAHLEDLIEIEKRRAGKHNEKVDNKMTFSEASRLINSSIRVMRVLGWAWRWAEWWVDYDSSWEPLLEPGEKEEEMTKEQLKIIDSSRESRALDARKCRLSAFAAALRNRAYDTEDGFDKESLNRALRSLLHTESLVGPWEPYEIEFLVDWLGRAYKSKSRLLGYGDDKIPVVSDAFCVHMKDGTPKYELGSRLIPGKMKLSPKQKFEEGVEEVDDFLRTEILEDVIPPKLPSAKRKRGPRKTRKRQERPPGLTASVDPPNGQSDVSPGSAVDQESPVECEISRISTEDPADAASASSTGSSMSKQDKLHSGPPKKRRKRNPDLSRTAEAQIVPTSGENLEKSMVQPLEDTGNERARVVPARAARPTKSLTDISESDVSTSDEDPHQSSQDRPECRNVSALESTGQETRSPSVTRTGRITSRPKRLSEELPPSNPRAERKRRERLSKKTMPSESVKSSHADSDGVPGGNVEGRDSVAEPVEEAGPCGLSPSVTCQGDRQEKPDIGSNAPVEKIAKETDEEEDSALPLDDLVTKSSV